MVAVPSAIEELWRVFDTLRSHAGDPKAPTIHKSGLTRLKVDVPASTIRGWIGEKCRQTGELRRRVPRDEEQFIAVIMALRLLTLERSGSPVGDRTPITLSVSEKDGWLSRLRAAKAEEDANAAADAAKAQDDAAGEAQPDDRPPTSQPEPDDQSPSSGEQDVPSPPPSGDPPRPRRRHGSAVTWIAASVAVLVAAAAGVTMLLINDDPPLVTYYKHGRYPTSPGPLPNGGPAVACPPATTNKPDNVIEAEGGVAYAEYYRKNNLFLVYDNEPDGSSAILQLTVPGVSRTDWYNAKGHTCNGRKRPMAMVVDKVEPHDMMEVRVCVGEWGDRGRVPPEHCGHTVRITSSE